MDPVSGYGLSLVTGVVILAVAVPWVARIRHPQQKPVAAYLIFVSVFAAAAFALFSLLAWLAGQLGVGPALGHPLSALLFLLLVAVPAIALATWQARKPPWRQGPPP